MRLHFDIIGGSVAAVLRLSTNLIGYLSNQFSMILDIRWSSSISSISKVKGMGKASFSVCDGYMQEV